MIPWQNRQRFAYLHAIKAVVIESGTVVGCEQEYYFWVLRHGVFSRLVAFQSAKAPQGRDSRKVAKAQSRGRVSSNSPSGRVTCFAPLRLREIFRCHVVGLFRPFFGFLATREHEDHRDSSAFFRSNNVWRTRAGMIECGHVTNCTIDQDARLITYSIVGADGRGRRVSNGPFSAM